ncbi:helix-turn-helix domain-containing protein [Bremerella sp.]|uniref:AraC family transcriptional regulator n=1 Tax=Bremerella sp. TaxID=2795602 RepID=UPI00391C4075
MLNLTPSLTNRALEETLPSWGVLILESHHGPDFEMEFRVHDFVKVLYVISGSGHVHVAEDRHEVGPRDMVVVLPGRKNRIEDSPNSPISCYVLCVHRSLLTFDPQAISALPLGLLPRQAHFAQRIERRLRRLLYQQLQNSPLTPLAMVSNGLEILSLISNHRVDKSEGLTDLSQEPGVDEMVAYIRHLDTHFFEATTIDEASSSIGIPRRRFTQLFRGVTGQTWLNYVQELRVEHACKLLETTDRPITSIAFECGFAELSTFYRAFRKMRDVTPSAWRRSRAD